MLFVVSQCWLLSPIRLAISSVAGQVTNRSSPILSSLDNSQTQWDTVSGLTPAKSKSLRIYREQLAANGEKHILLIKKVLV